MMDVLTRQYLKVNCEVKIDIGNFELRASLSASRALKESSRSSPGKIYLTRHKGKSELCAAEWIDLQARAR